MILQSLHQLYDRLEADKAYDVAPPGFSPQKISFKVVLNRDGSLNSIQDARVKDEKGKLVPSRHIVPGDGKRSGQSPVPFFSWDNALYLLGHPPKDRSSNWALERFSAFRERHLKVRNEIACDEIRAICAFLENWNPLGEYDREFVSEIGSHYGVFQFVDSPSLFHEAPAIVEWWMRNQLVDSEPDGQCLITGERSKIARLHPTIKGVTPPKGKQQQDGPLVAIDKGKSAFSSYLKEQSYNAPVGENAAFRYGAALNALLSGPRSGRHRMRIGDTTCVFWTDQPTVLEDIWAEFSSNGSAVLQDPAQDEETRKKVEIFLDALRKGREADAGLADAPDQRRFFILGLAPNAARLSIRFFYQSSISELLDHLRAHKTAFEIVRQFDNEPEFPAWWQFLRQTARAGDEPPPLLGGALMRSILEGVAYPESLLSAVVRRVQMERTVNYLRAAAIKAVLVRNHRQPLHLMLDPENPQPAYRLGRLFAVLEKIHEEGHREQTGRSLDKTIRDTYFSAACATPASVFPRLEVLSTHHRRHLNPGRKTQFDKLIGDIKWEQTGTARTHHLEDQGLFILGYYHQRKDLFTSKSNDTENAPQHA